MKPTFKELINGDKAVLVDFYADWCGPCKAMNPILKEVAADLGDEAKIIKVNIDKNNALAQKLQVQSIPTFILFKNGRVQWRMQGMQSAQHLSQSIRKHTD